MVTCDKCGHYAFFAYSDYGDMLIIARGQGWVIKPGVERGDWKHYCRECKEGK